MQSPYKISAIAGSLRRGSYNRALLRACIELAPPGLAISLLEIRELPLYDGDLDGEHKPASVVAFKQAIAEADGLLIATPEYNYGIPGPLKNAIDWASRPAYRSVLTHKPVAMLGAAGSVVGTARAQGQLKQVLLGTLSEVFPHPEVLVGQVGDKVDGEGHLHDPKTREILSGMLAAYAAWLEPRLPRR